MKNNLLLAAIISITSLLACGESYYRQGERIYKANCASCHMDDGSGLSNLIPALRIDGNIDSSILRNYVCIIRYGIDNQDSILQMPPNQDLSDIEITNVINYLTNDMNSINKEITLPQTKRYLAECDH